MAPGVLALLVAFALSPVAVELARHLATEPSKLAVIAVPFLLWRLIRRERQVAVEQMTDGRGTGFVCIGLAVALELLALGAGLPRLGRPALALAVFGWLRASGLAGPGAASFAVFLVPVPSLLSQSTSPALENTWKTLASAVLPGVQGGAFPIDLHHGDGGWAVAWLGAAVGAFAARRVGASLGRAMALIALGIVAGFFCQGSGVMLAGLLVPPLDPATGRGILTVAPALVLLALAGLALKHAPLPAIAPDAST